MRRGVSLVELLVAIALGALVSAIALTLLFNSNRMATLGVARLELEQRGQVILTRLTADLQNTVAGGVSVCHANPPAVAVNPMKRDSLGNTADGTGSVNWADQYHIYFQQSTDQTFRLQNWPPDPALENAEWTTPVRPKHLLATKLQSILGDTSTSAIIGQECISFSIEPPDSDKLVRQPLKFTVVLQRQSNTGKSTPERVQLSRTVFLAGSQ